jgi:hypothetical protein
MTVLKQYQTLFKLAYAFSTIFLNGLPKSQNLVTLSSYAGVAQG